MYIFYVSKAPWLVAKKGPLSGSDLKRAISGASTSTYSEVALCRALVTSNIHIDSGGGGAVRNSQGLARPGSCAWCDSFVMYVMMRRVSMVHRIT